MDAGAASESGAARRDEEGAGEEGAALDVAALKRSLSQLRELKAEDDARQWKAAFGADAAVSDACGDADDDDAGFEVVGTF
jgi:hypothetical protein